MNWIRIQQLILILIIQYCFIGCSVDDDFKKHSWITYTINQSGIYLKQESDTVLFAYGLLYQECDTIVSRKISLEIVEQNDNILRFEFSDGRSGEIRIAEDSNIFCFEPAFPDDSLTCYKLNSAINIESQIIHRKVDLSYYLAETISYQEIEIKDAYSTIMLEDKAKVIFDKFLFEKKRLISKYFNIEYRSEMCWTNIVGLDNLLIEPKFKAKGNLESIRLNTSTKLMIEYLMSLAPESQKSIHIEILNQHKLFQNYDNLNNEYITVGETIIYYNNLLLEIFRVNRN